ncbi:MAG: TRAP transporter substrate-binding protein DctP, partial [Gammaproteobacteria bacterium]|nr:TRAP transporter substrate-binding protein DctP [Gammaproteobacteria bacterium]
LYGLPFLFDSLEEVDVVRKAMDRTMIEGLREKGLVSFGLASGGFAHIMSNEPVRNVQDMKGKRVWVPEGDLISYAAMERFGLSPVTLPATDVLTGLQTGLIDVIGSSAIGALVLQWHTKVNYISTMPVSYLFGLMAIEEKYYERLSPADQRIVEDVYVRMYQQMEISNNVDNAAAMTALEESGLKLIPPEDGLLVSLKKESRQLWFELAQGPNVDEAQLKAIDALLEAHRNSVSAGAP